MIVKSQLAFLMSMMFAFLLIRFSIKTPPITFRARARAPTTHPTKQPAVGLLLRLRNSLRAKRRTAVNNVAVARAMAGTSRVQPAVS